MSEDEAAVDLSESKRFEAQAPEERASVELHPLDGTPITRGDIEWAGEVLDALARQEGLTLRFEYEEPTLYRLEIPLILALKATGLHQAKNQAAEISLELRRGNIQITLSNSPSWLGASRMQLGEVVLKGIEWRDDWRASLQRVE